MAANTYEQAVAAIRRGESVLVNGAIHTRVESLPSEAEWAASSGNAEMVDAARANLQGQMASLQAQMDVLNSRTTPRTEEGARAAATAQEVNRPGHFGGDVQTGAQFTPQPGQRTLSPNAEGGTFIGRQVVDSTGKIMQLPSDQDAPAPALRTGLEVNQPDYQGGATAEGVAADQPADGGDAQDGSTGDGNDGTADTATPGRRKQEKARE